MTNKPWKLSWKLKEPDENGRRNKHDDYASEIGARHDGQHLWDSGTCVSVTLINDTLRSTHNRVVATWPRQRRRKRR